VHRASAFFSWLLSSHPDAAEHHRRHGLPTNSSRLYVLLRACPSSKVRSRVRQYHRMWRVHRKFKELERTGQIKRIAITDFEVTSIPDDVLDTAVMRTGTLTFTADFGADTRVAEIIAGLEMFLQCEPPQRWDRVVRRWEAKHTISMPQIIPDFTPLDGWVDVKPLTLIAPPGMVSRHCLFCDKNITVRVDDPLCSECGAHE
jgi:hypothetical protein